MDNVEADMPATKPVRCVCGKLPRLRVNASAGHVFYACSCFPGPASLHTLTVDVSFLADSWNTGVRIFTEGRKAAQTEDTNA